jgi:AAA domain
LAIPHKSLRCVKYNTNHRSECPKKARPIAVSHPRMAQGLMCRPSDLKLGSTMAAKFYGNSMQRRIEMSKIAYLIGESGSGKTTLAERIEKSGLATVVTGDLVLHHAMGRLCPYVKSRHCMAPDLWESLASHCDLRSAFRRTIVDLYPRLPASNKPILAEATLFCLARVQCEFQLAIADVRPDVRETRTFWLDATPERLVEYIGERPRDETKIDLGEARKRLEYFTSRLGGREDMRSHDAEVIAVQIAAYLEE